MSARDKIEVLDHGVLRFLTAGSVDDGKSTLIGRLLYDTQAILADQLAAIERTSQRRGQSLDLSLLTDGLTAEREQGITIDVAYRYFATALRKFIIADAPGHEQYTRNMVTAASTAQLAILLVDARHGVVTQTRRHATLAHHARHPASGRRGQQDGPRRLRAGRVRRHRARVRRFCAALRASAPLRFVPMSALAGDMVVDRGEQPRLVPRARRCSQILETVEVAQTLADAPVPLSGAVRGASDGGRRPRGYMGRIESGSIAVGDRVTALPSGRTHARARDPRRRRCRSRAPACTPRSRWRSTTSSTSRAATCWCASTPRPGQPPRSTRRYAGCRMRPLDPRRRYLLRHTTREVRARIERIDHRWNVSTQQKEPAPETLAMNDIGSVGLTLVAAGICRPLRGQPGDRQLHPHRRGDQQHRRRGAHR